MNFSYRIRGLKELRTALQGAPALIASANAEALDESVGYLKAELSARIPEGPAHFGMHLRDSLQTRLSTTARAQRGEVLSLLPQARWFEGGTKPHDIVAKGKALHVGGDQFARVVHHPGAKGRHAARRVLAANKSMIRVIFANALQRAVSRLATHG